MDFTQLNWAGWTILIINCLGYIGIFVKETIEQRIGTFIGVSISLFVVMAALRII